MKKGLFGHFRFGMFRTIFMSLLGSILLTIGIMSFVMTNTYMESMKEEEIKLIKSKLYGIVVDLEDQIENMKEIRAEISVRQEFKKDYIKKSKYNEIALMSQLNNYDRVNDIWNQCFVKQADYENIMSSQKVVTDIEIYLKNLYGEESMNEVTALIDKLYLAKGKDMVVYSDGVYSLFLLPILSYGEQGGKQMILGFEVSGSAIGKRIEALVGDLSSELCVTYQGEIIYGNHLNSEELTEAVVYDSDFKVFCRLEEQNWFFWQSFFTFETVLKSLLIGFLVMCLVFGLAFWNFKPVRKLVVKYLSVENTALVPSLDGIDRLIEEMIRGKEKDSELLQEQYKLLKEQVAYLIISGYSAELLRSHMTLLNINYEQSFFGVISCELLKREQITDLRIMNEAIADLSDEDIMMYPCVSLEEDIKILVVVQEADLLNEALDLLRNLFDTMNLDAGLKLSSRSEGLVTWEHFTEDELNEETCAVMGNNAKQKKIVKQVMEYLEQHFEEYDLSLETIAASFGMHPVYLSRIIRQELGKGYKDYLLELRISKAKKLLQQTDLTVTEVCKAVGYANTSHFIKLFRKHTGETPAGFRELCLKNQ